jgi:hypothetical protein
MSLSAVAQVVSVVPPRQAMAVLWASNGARASNGVQLMTISRIGAKPDAPVRAAQQKRRFAHDSSEAHFSRDVVFVSCDACFAVKRF